MSFLFPWLLGALAVVPALWWLLRTMPPRPREVSFPAYFLLDGLKSDIRTAARTPWWLMILRTLIVVLFIVSLAEPVERTGDSLPGTGGSVIVAVDNGWASAAQWRQRQDKLRDVLRRIGGTGRSVILLPTAPADTDGAVRALGPMSVEEAVKQADRLAPHPWNADYAAAAKAVGEAPVSYAVFLSDGTYGRGLQDFMAAIRERGGLTVVNDEEVNTPLILRKKKGGFVFEVERLTPAPPGSAVMLMAYGADGGVLDELRVPFSAGATKAEATWDIPGPMRGEIERIAVREQAMASASFLTDSRWRQHPVGIVADPGRSENKSFLNEVYYLRSALGDGGAVAVDVPTALLKNPLSAIIWPDSAQVPAVERAALLEWVRAGGFLIRFAGPGLAANSEDALLPVRLRHGQRAMEGALTWEKPVALGGMPEDSPLLGLSVPGDVTVTRQILADPSPETFEKTWLRLEDGTPLITGGPAGQGMVVLIHTTAGPSWSNFCYSGLYVEALQRMVSLSAGIADYKAQVVLPPLMLSDGFGRLHAPPENGFAVPVDPNAAFMPAPATPPGLYGDRREFQVFNLGDYLPGMARLSALPMGTKTETYALSGDHSLKADLFRLALLLVLLDTLVTLALRGVFTFSRATAVLVFTLLLAASPAQADSTDEADLVSGIYLAYVETGDQDTDETSYNGLMGLAQILRTRTVVDVKGVRGVNPAIDPLYYYPVLYWPMTRAGGGLSGEGARNLRNYMAQGGMVFFDTRDAQFGTPHTATPGTVRLREIAQGLDIPELMVVERGHILTKSFYLLHDFPGRFAGGKLWVEREPNQSHDGVTSVIIGAGDYAAAWSRDDRDRARFSVQGGEYQREMAYRSGVNVVMTALAGNYKADQVHVPYILERLGR